MELIRPKITRFATRFLSLRAIVIQEDNLKHMFSHTEWLSSVYSRLPNAHALNSLFHSERFWIAAHEAVSISEPLLKILRMVDGDMPAMGSIYAGIERAKIAIKTYYRAAAFLNPSVHHSSSLKIDRGIRNGFQEVMMRMAAKEADKSEFTKEHPVYINAQGALGTEFSVLERTLNAPGDWWAAYGYEIPTLQKVAIWIFSQPCSSHWCGWNWCTFENLHTKERNATDHSKLSDLIFVHFNLYLQTISCRMNGKSKRVVHDQIDVSAEWPTESEVSSPILDDSWLESLLGFPGT